MLLQVHDELVFNVVEEELSEVEERLNLVNSLKMKYGNSIDEIEEYFSDLL